MVSFRSNQREIDACMWYVCMCNINEEAACCCGAHIVAVSRVALVLSVIICKHSPCLFL